ncbi:uncharacterized protein LOC120346830 [Styela clava]
MNMEFSNMQLVFMIVYLTQVFEVSATALQFCESDLSCQQELNYCCKNPYPHCCEYDRFVHDSNINDDNNEAFLKSGLKSALVLLIMSSAIFLLCFCVMRCCRRATPSHMRRGTLADFNTEHGLVPITRQLSSRTLRIIGISVSHPPEETRDDPPSYNEIAQSAVPGEETEKPPEYSSIFKDSDT